MHIKLWYGSDRPFGIKSMAFTQCHESYGIVDIVANDKHNILLLVEKTFESFGRFIKIKSEYPNPSSPNMNVPFISSSNAFFLSSTVRDSESRHWILSSSLLNAIQATPIMLWFPGSHKAP